MYCLYTEKKIHGTGNFLSFESVQNINVDNFVPFGRPPSGKVIIQIIIEFPVPWTKYEGLSYPTHFLKSRGSGIRNYSWINSILSIHCGVMMPCYLLSKCPSY